MLCCVSIVVKSTELRNLMWYFVRCFLGRLTISRRGFASSLLHAIITAHGLHHTDITYCTISNDSSLDTNALRQRLYFLTSPFCIRYHSNKSLVSSTRHSCYVTSVIQPPLLQVRTEHFFYIDIIMVIFILIIHIIIIIIIIINITRKKILLQRIANKKWYFVFSFPVKKDQKNRSPIR